MKRTIALPDVSNEPLLDFSDRTVEERIRAEIALLRQKGIVRASPLIAGKPRATARKIEARNPSNPRELLGAVCAADEEVLKEVIRCSLYSHDAYEWAHMPLSARAPYLRRAADILRARRITFIARMMLEVGKSALRVDAEVCEAIDMLTHYAAYAEFLEELGNKMLFSPQGEENTILWKPYGGQIPITASIQPWNFPVAISAGSIAAALVCGHSVLYKPAEQASLIGYFVTQVFYDAGIPADVFHFIPGYGEEIGSALVRHPKVSGILFTGSSSVRAAIQDAINQFNKEELPLFDRGAHYPKKGIALESGGKNAIIVLPDANEDRALEDVSDSAFGFQGQLCSACSRVILVNPDTKEGNRRFERFIERLKERIESFSIGSPEDFKNQIGPLIDTEAVKKVSACMELAAKEGTILARGAAIPQNGGYFISPLLVGNLLSHSTTAQEEIFGPVLSVFRAPTLDEALRIANGTKFALTGGIHTRNPEWIRKATREFSAGNLYVNRRITGAMVGRQPFGGFRESGNGTKAGGWTYLINFLNEVSVSRNTMECGIPMEME